MQILRSRSCVDCGETDADVLEFDHLGPKRAEIKTLMHQGLSTPALLNEITECDVVCANCHRRRTAKRGRWWRLDPQSLERGSGFLPGERRNITFLRECLITSACVDCGLDDLVVLDFDHVDGKQANVPTLARRGSSLLRLAEEIARCAVRCANCHRRRTLARLSRGSTPRKLIPPP